MLVNYSVGDHYGTLSRTLQVDSNLGINLKISWYVSQQTLCYNFGHLSIIVERLMTALAFENVNIHVLLFKMRHLIPAATRHQLQVSIVYC